jgi:protein TonB
MNKAHVSDSNPHSEDSNHPAVSFAFGVSQLSSSATRSRIETFYSNLKYVIRNAIAPATAARLDFANSLGPVPGISTMSPQFTRVQALSLSLHVLVLALMILPMLPIWAPFSTGQRRTPLIVPSDLFSSYARQLPPGADQAHGGGGGGEHNPIPASVGRAPIFGSIQLTPPAVKPPEDPKMPAPPSLLGPTELHLNSPNLSNWGDPNSNVSNDSSGPGGGSGIGGGHNGGIGDGDGRGFGPGMDGGTGNGPYSQGTHGYGFPTCLYCPNPQFTGEAIKAKVAGTVLISAIITADGRATNIRIVRGLGFGLDDNAIEAVRHWRFRPALGPDHKPAAVVAPIEVIFHIY